MSYALRLAILSTTLVASNVSAAADPMGRLFFTPTQRNVLDAGKFTVAPKTPPKPLPRSVQLNGVVTRSDADRTVWVNGKPYHNRSPEGMLIGTNPSTPGSTSIQVPGRGTSSRVKVGQHIDLNSGRVGEGAPRQATEVPRMEEAAAVATPQAAVAAPKPEKPAAPQAAAH